MQKTRALLVGPPKPIIVDGLRNTFELLDFADTETNARLSSIAESIRAIVVTSSDSIDAELMSRFPQLEIVSSFGAGYQHIDVNWAKNHRVVVTNTPNVLNEEVADTTLGLLLYTLEKSYLRLQGRTVGIAGLGRIGKEVAKRLDAFNVPIAYFGRRRQDEVPYRYYSNLVQMAADVDTLVVITPGGVETQNLINSQVLNALGPRGILVNMARGSVVDEKALIEALRNRTILSAGLDVFVDEPQVPRELIEMEHIVLLPHVGSASVHTRTKMDQLVVDNLLAWSEKKPPLTPVPETPLPQTL